MIIKGDVNGDGRINATDLLLVKMHLLGEITLEGDSFTAADVTNDGVIDTADLASINLHLLGQEMINEVIK